MRRAAKRGLSLDLRRIARRSLPRGGEPVDLIRKRRPDRPMRLVCLLDVSGSMDVYARVFLAFVRGLTGADDATRAWLFHTRLVDATPALRDPDRLRMADRLSLMAEGFGGGTRLGGCLSDFVERHAAQAVNRRTVVVILSDGCYSDRPDRLAATLAAALPHLDAFLPASTLGDLAALEAEFARL